MLEKEIATNPQYYSSQTNPYTNAGTYDFYTGYTDWRPSTGNADQTWWGHQMKSTIAVVDGPNPNGSSKTNGYGFNVFILGGLSGGNPTTYGTYTHFWSSSSNTGTTAWRRLLGSGSSGVARSTINKNTMVSVRCKKNDN
jgi:uncharacterized protein (TIGR02145 family)